MAQKPLKSFPEFIGIFHLTIFSFSITKVISTSSFGTNLNGINNGTKIKKCF